MTPDQMYDSMVSIPGYVFVCLLIVFFVGSIILFIIDAVKARKENRKIKTWIKVIFIINMVHIGIAVALLIFFFAIMLLFFLVYAFFPR